LPVHLSEMGKYYYVLGANGIEIKGHSYKNPSHCPDLDNTTLD